MEMSRLTRGGTIESVSRDQILRRERGQGNIHFPCSADHVQDWQPYPVDSYSCYMCHHASIHTYMHAPRQPTRVSSFSLICFCFFGDVAFSEYFCTIAVLSLHAQYVVYVPTYWYSMVNTRSRCQRPKESLQQDNLEPHDRHALFTLIQHSPTCIHTYIHCLYSRTLGGQTVLSC